MTGEPLKIPTEPIHDSEIKDTFDTEVLVVGAGNAGLFAAIAAAEKGAKRQSLNGKTKSA